jgi:hypothetical protein
LDDQPRDRRSGTWRGEPGTALQNRRGGHETAHLSGFVLAGFEIRQLIGLTVANRFAVAYLVAAAFTAVGGVSMIMSHRPKPFSSLNPNPALSSRV